MFVARKHVFCREKSMLDATKLLARQTYVCRDKSKLLPTKLLLRQNYVCRDKYLSGQKFCRDKHSFVATKQVF